MTFEDIDKEGYRVSPGPTTPEPKDNETTFEEDFPELIGMGSGYQTTNRPDGIKKQTKVFVELDIQEHCKSNQRIREAIEKIGRELPHDVHPCEVADIILKQLRLNK